MEEREKLVLQLEFLIELDRRKLFFHYESLRDFVMSECGMEEWNAEKRIRAARMLRRLPELKPLLESGGLNITLLELAQGYANREKLDDVELTSLLVEMSGMSCRKAKRFLGSRYPLTTELPRDRICPLNDEWSQVSCVMRNSVLDKIDELKGLLAHSHPGISLGELMELLVTDYHTRHHPEQKAKRAEMRAEKKGEKESPREAVQSPTAQWVPSSIEKRVPTQALIHELTLKEGYQCAYVDPASQKKCQSKFGLEVDHIRAWSEGGQTELSNLRYLCRNHHRRVSFKQFGESSKYFGPKRE